MRRATVGPMTMSGFTNQLQSMLTMQIQQHQHTDDSDLNKSSTSSLYDELAEDIQNPYSGSFELIREREGKRRSKKSTFGSQFEQRSNSRSRVSNLNRSLEQIRSTQAQKLGLRRQKNMVGPQRLRPMIEPPQKNFKSKYAKLIKRAREEQMIESEHNKTMQNFSSVAIIQPSQDSINEAYQVSGHFKDSIASSSLSSIRIESSVDNIRSGKKVRETSDFVNTDTAKEKSRSQVQKHP